MAKKATIGDNSKNVSAEQLRSMIERIERIDEEKAALGDDRKEIFAEAKSAGFNAKAMRTLIKQRRQDPATMEEEIELVNVYRRALGMDTFGL